MKVKSLTFLFVFILSFFYSQNGIQFNHQPFSELLTLAKKENKLIFLDAYASWCGPCKMMSKKIFPLEKVGQFYNQHFINAQIDMEKGEGKALRAKYQVRAYPTYLFIDGDGQLVSRSMGYQEANQFIQSGQQALYDNQPLSALITAYQNGDYTPGLLKKIALATLTSNPSLSSEVTQKYFEVKKKDYDRLDLKLLLAGIHSTESPNYKIFKAKKEAFLQSLLPEESYNSIDLAINANEVYQKTFNPETKTLDKKKFIEILSQKVGEKKANEALKNYERHLKDQ